MSAAASAAPWAAVIAPVREVILAGTADLAYWREQLRPEGLRPAEVEGRAALLVTAMSAKFNGLPFREWTVAVQVVEGDGAFLVQAFNSSRLLGWAERRLFRTPYSHAAIELGERAPAHLRVAPGATTALAARMGPGAAGEQRHEIFAGPIYLPGDGRGRGEMFTARLEGTATIIPFDPARDMLTIDPAGGAVFSHLAASGFRVREWRLRDAATHARSRTAARDRG